MEETNIKLICLALKDDVSPLTKRHAVLTDSPLVYEDGEMEHPAIHGLMLTKDQRLYGALLEIVDSYFVYREETDKEKGFRIQWKKPIPMTRSDTEGDFVKMDMTLFRQIIKPKQTHCYPDEIEARKIKEAEAKEKRLLREAQMAADLFAKEAARISALTSQIDNERLSEEANAAAKLATKEIARHSAMDMTLEILCKHLMAALEVVELAKTKIDCSDAKYLRWLEWRLANVVSRLQSLISEIESGVSIAEPEFFDNGDFKDEVEIMEMEITKLKAQIQMLRGVER